MPDKGERTPENHPDVYKLDLHMVQKALRSNDLTPIWKISGQSSDKEVTTSKDQPAEYETDPLPGNFIIEKPFKLGDGFIELPPPFVIEDIKRLIIANPKLLKQNVKALTTKTHIFNLRYAKGGVLRGMGRPYKGENRQGNFLNLTQLAHDLVRQDLVRQADLTRPVRDSQITSEFFYLDLLLDPFLAELPQHIMNKYFFSIVKDLDNEEGYILKIQATDAEGFEILRKAHSDIIKCRNISALIAILNQERSPNSQANSNEVNTMLSFGSQTERGYVLTSPHGEYYFLLLNDSKSAPHNNYARLISVYAFLEHFFGEEKQPKGTIPESLDWYHIMEVYWHDYHRDNNHTIYIGIYQHFVNFIISRFPGTGLINNFSYLLHDALHNSASPSEAALKIKSLSQAALYREYLHQGH